MSLLVDYRVGSVEFVALLKQIGVDVEMAELPFADFAFLGSGSAGEQIPIGIERKTVQDLINSTMKGRLSGHQLPGMLDQERSGFKEIWLVVEGIYRPGKPGGVLEVLHGKEWRPLTYGAKTFMYRELECQLVTLEVKAGVRVRRCGTKDDTAYFLAALYHWWTHASLDEHRSHLRFRTLDADSALLIKPGLCREWARHLPGVGWEKSMAIEQQFKRVAIDMAQASEAEWAEIAGIGKTMARRIWGAIRGLKL